MTKWLKFKRRKQRGQSIIILAIAFLALLGFVGIVTDISLLFVRYAALRRAVDAAAIAAAGQMRTDRNVANLGLAARQFIEFHGLNPVMVAAETCLISPNDPQLCPTAANPTERKLVRVTAQVRSDTVFMRLLGFPSITLEAVSMSETAVLDVVIIMDVSESMLDLTPWYDNSSESGDWDYADLGMGFMYRPPTIPEVQNRLNQAPGTPPNGTAWDWYNTWDYFVRMSQQQASTHSAVQALTQVRTFGSATLQPRSECRIRFFPYGFRRDIQVPNETWDGYYNYMVTNQAWPSSYTYWYGWVPTYNFYGCCNDPGDGTVDLDGNITMGSSPSSANRDWNFSDLICQPFKDARDAVRRFLLRVDFTRGDRVAFVTFDRTAFLIDPDGTNGTAGSNSTHMIDRQTLAIETLNRFIGVGAEPSRYDWREDAGGWMGYADGVTAGGASVPVDYDFNDPAIRSYPVWQSCDFQNATLFRPLTLTAPTNGSTALNQMGHPLPSERGGLTIHPSNIENGDLRPDYRYEYRARCSAANMGAALRVANNALLDPLTIRSNGAVWVIILVSDGGVGASDPVVRNGNLLTMGNPYVSPPPTNPDGPWGSVGTYGAYGLCPYENIVDGRFFPYCQDESPQTRHFCFDETGENRDVNGNPAFVDLGSTTFCPDPDEYDVDDYTRDWADFVALRRDDATLLPTIFTIGFGITFDNGGGCDNNLEDCLGEEMLRYIADVGDNNQLDTDFQQDWVDNNGLDGSVDYGPRGICEDPDGDPGEYAPLASGQSCGNYFNAPGQEELEDVFNTIASRMFTRIAG